ncbi:MAG: adenosylcobinamide-GDP ribazoletransferase [Hyphomicrobiaceae bacterium]|nr:adenosylcobinamide-GDP ribazoletransferase [Hyphomicrobiaceae bacterium]
MSDQPAKPAAPSAAEAAPSSHLPVPVAPPHRSRPLLGAIGHILSALRFYSRLPIPVFAFEAAPHAAPDFTRAPAAVAVAGALLGAFAGIVLYLASAIGLPPLLAALLAVTSLVLITGALHEDGLADTADGLGGGQTIERRLDIMRDSRIGSYGASAIVLMLAIRATALATLTELIDPAGAALAIVAVAATSRAAGLLPLWLLPAARADGAAASVSPPTTGSMRAGMLAALAITLAAMWVPGILVIASAIGVGAAFAAAYAITRIAEAKIGGHTGDIAGAAQQLADAAMLIALAAAASPQWLIGA